MTCLMFFGNCTCGKRYIVFHPEKKTLAEKYSKLIGKETDFFVAENNEVHCSFCGARILLPIPETLDWERDPRAEEMQTMLEEIETHLEKLINERGIS